MHIHDIINKRGEKRTEREKKTGFNMVEHNARPDSHRTQTRTNTIFTAYPQTLSFLAVVKRRDISPLLHLSSLLIPKSEQNLHYFGRTSQIYTNPARLVRGPHLKQQYILTTANTAVSIYYRHVLCVFFL